MNEDKETEEPREGPRLKEPVATKALINRPNSGNSNWHNSNFGLTTSGAATGSASGASTAIAYSSNSISNLVLSPYSDTDTRRKVVALEREVSDLRQKLLEKEGQEEAIEALKKMDAVKHLITRVNEHGASEVLNNSDFQQEFATGEQHSTFVMSVDIRQSTTLMLKAKTAERFATFISELCMLLMNIVKSNYGVVDKFTDDGILAFFPSFYSGDDAGLFAVRAALSCHETFRKHYIESRSSFASVPTNIGLGIGIDCGETLFLTMADGLTVIGQPVVYACRLGAAPSGTTYLNQTAYEIVHGRWRSVLHFREETIPFKGEGEMLAYAVESTSEPLSPQPPPWAVKHIGQGSESDRVNGSRSDGSRSG
jgi:class 3 adenylate cyclase